MAKKTYSLFFRYFKDCFLIMLSFIFIITILLGYFIYNYANTSKSLYRTQATEQSNQLIANTLDYCTNIFVSLSSDLDVQDFLITDVSKANTIDCYNITQRIKSILSNKIVGNDYINSIYLCSPDKNYVISNNGFKMTDDFSKYVWYDESLINNIGPVRLSVKSTTQPNGKPGYIMLYKVIDSTISDDNICIIVINAAVLQKSISEIFYDNDCSFLIRDKQNNTGLLNSGIDPESVKKILSSSTDTEKSSFFNHGLTSKLFYLDDYNWDCVYVYDNTALNRQIFETLLFIIPVSFATLLLIALALSYIRAKKAYLPINKMVSTLSNQKNNINIQDIASNYQYTELNYITELLIDYINDKQKLQDELAKRLQQLNDANKYALEVQIQPHFIFNTLEIIYLEAYELFGDENIISLMVYNLSDILRVTFRNDNKFMPISSEIDYIKKYLFIQKVRFENLFETVYDIDDESENLMTPKLILQPIVENSIVHGIIPAERKCTIKICNRIYSDHVVFTIEDDGIGMSEERLKEIQEILNDTSSLPDKNIGIANVNMRIKLLFGSEYGCKIISSNSKGTKIEISLPCIQS